MRLDRGLSNFSPSEPTLPPPVPGTSPNEIESAPASRPEARRAAREEIALNEETFVPPRTRLQRVPDAMVELASEVRRELGAFVARNSKGEFAYGFHTNGGTPVSVERLEDVCRRGIDVLERQIGARGEVTPQSLAKKILAGNMQNSLEEFHVMLARGAKDGVVGTSDASAVVDAAIELKHRFTNFGIQLEGLSAGFQVG